MQEKLFLWFLSLYQGSLESDYCEASRIMSSYTFLAAS